MTSNPFEPLDGPIADAIDLHGMRGSEAGPAVEAFLARARRRSPGGLVHVITGRGRGSRGAPVLRTRVRTMLRDGVDGVAAWGEDLDGGGFLIRLAR